jgi:uncharacterized membrane protein YdbT with pleckstrin-like domain
MTMNHEETTIMEFGPSAKGFIVAILLGIMLLPMFIGIFILLGVCWALKATKYKLTNQRFFVRTGLIARRVEELELFRIKDVSMRQGIIQRLMGVGNVTILSTDDSTPVVHVGRVSKPEKVKEEIRRQARAARQSEKGLTEFIHS